MVIEINRREVVRFFVPGVPAAQTRARHTAGGGVYSNATEGLKRWKGALTQEMLKALRMVEFAPLAGALSVDLVFQLPTRDRSRWGELAGMKPDKDNLEKAVLDVMGDSGFFVVGDSQVAAGEVVKLWCAPGQGGVWVVVSHASTKKNPPAPGNERGEAVGWLSSRG